jgi:hypothetical protein
MRVSKKIESKAKAVGVDSKNMKNKVDLIRAIQRAEGNNPCYGSGNYDCPYTDCCFMVDCMDEKPAVR